MKSVTDPSIDNDIRSALQDADKKGKLDVVAAVTGVAGGVKYLKEIMNSEGDLHIMDRGMLGLHLLS